MARSTVANTIERIRRQLDSTVRLEVNTLGATLTTSTNPVTLSYDLGRSIRSGSILSVGRELMRVISVDIAAKECTVIRGWQDSDAEAHAIGDEVLINPRWTRLDIYDGIIQEIDSWDPDIFKIEDQAVTVAENAKGFEVDSDHADAIGVISVRRNWTEDESVVWPDFPFDLHRGRSASLTPTEGTGLFIRFTGSGGRAPAAGTVVARFAVPYVSGDITAESTDLISDVGLTNSLLELVELGVKARLIMDDETPRSARLVQDEPRIAEETPPGAAMSLAQSILQRYERRRNLEIYRLRQLHSYRTW